MDKNYPRKSRNNTFPQKIIRADTWGNFSTTVYCTAVSTLEAPLHQTLF